MMFTELKVGEGITPIERDLAALAIAKADPDDWQPLERLAPAAWKIEQAPPGFRLNVHRRRALPDKSAELEHFIFSDGLATVSVYVQPAQPDGTISGVSRHGAANAVGRLLGDHEVIVVGEAPVQTLQLFAQAIQTSK
jgi:sigma-E factor negative regulatory protein RseB